MYFNGENQKSKNSFIVYKVLSHAIKIGIFVAFAKDSYASVHFISVIPLSFGIAFVLTLT